MESPKESRRAKGVRGRRFPPEPLERQEVLALMGVCSTTAPSGIRNRALIATLYRSGLWISEALDLRPKDIGSEAGPLRVLHGKGDQARTVAIDTEALTILGRWLKVRALRGIDGRSPVFCTLPGGSMDASYVQHMLRRLARRAGIEKRVHPHGLRHTHAAELAREGIPMNVIQAQLGQSGP
jgi:integrase/recombinase XerD